MDTDKIKLILLLIFALLIEAFFVMLGLTVVIHGAFEDRWHNAAAGWLVIYMGMEGIEKLVERRFR